MIERSGIGNKNLKMVTGKSPFWQKENALPKALEFAYMNLGERVYQENVSNMAINPTKLKLTTDSDVKVSFIGEGADYKNTLEYNINDKGISGGDPKLFSRMFRASLISWTPDLSFNDLDSFNNDPKAR